MSTPSDLITTKEAASLCERKPRTVRRWITDGHLTRYEGEAPPAGGQAPVLVSRGELTAYLLERGQKPKGSAHKPASGHVAKGDAGGGAVMRTSHVDTEVVQLRHEVEMLSLKLQHAEASTHVTLNARTEAHEAQLAALQAKADGLRLAMDQVRRELTTVMGELNDSKASAEDWKARHDALAQELAAVRERDGMPFWRRLLGASPTKALPEG